MDVENDDVIVAEASASQHKRAADEPRLTAIVVKRETVSAVTIDTMYSLYSAHYADTNREKFLTDLNSKTHVLLLQDQFERLCGFSTLELYKADYADESFNVVYSGDTIIDPKYWGNSALAFEWLKFVGRIKRQALSVPLYWLLIVKGHRTYRYLSTFAIRYTPHHSQASTAIEIDRLNALATKKFGACFNEKTGVAKFGPQGGRLSEELAQIPAAHAKRPAVAYFLERNPGYKQGDELVCLCELSEANLRPLAKRLFLAN